jgi:membrane protein DedA with SNARE-associated domain/rhodanese-related sulfurtransferase
VGGPARSEEAAKRCTALNWTVGPTLLNMSDLLQFLSDYGYLVVFGAAFAEQIGLPVPAVPLIVSMGALSRSGQFMLAGVVVIAASASLSADLIWYELGRYHGRSVLRLICRISLEPDYCVRRTEDAFERLGLWALLPAKFIPGFNAATVPLAGMMKTPLLKYLLFDGAGALLWAGVYASLGFIFSREIEQILTYLATFGVSIVILVAIGLGIYIAYKLDQRRRFLKELQVSRITPEELKAKMDAREKIMVFDIRNRLDRRTDPVRIPGAFHILPEHIDFQPEDLSPDQEIIVYCTCPNEATSARVAVKLQRMGLKHARPLQGGLDAWREKDLPVEYLD